MFVLFAILFCLLFLIVGAAVFLLMLLHPHMRQHALSAALWCALWGPSLLAWLMFGGLVGIAASYGMGHGNRAEVLLERWREGLGATMAFVALITTAAVASALAWLHQAIIHRMTFALFRLYATLVVAGIGSVLGWAVWLMLGTTMSGWFVFPSGLASMIVLASGFGYGGWRWAAALRGDAPERFTWISP